MLRWPCSLNVQAIAEPAWRRDEVVGERVVQHLIERERGLGRCNLCRWNNACRERGRYREHWQQLLHSADYNR